MASDVILSAGIVSDVIASDVIASAVIASDVIASDAVPSDAAPRGRHHVESDHRLWTVYCWREAREAKWKKQNTVRCEV